MEYDIEQINNNIQNLISQCDLYNELKTKLKNAGFTDEELEQIDDELQYFDACIITGDLTSLPEYNQKFAKELNEQLEKIIPIQEETSYNSLESAYLQKYQIDNEIISDKPINSKEEVITFKEPIVSGKVTNPKNLDDAHYTLKEDYPDSYGFIDKAKNWFKINTRKNKAEFVHSSGTLIKIDKEGNVTIHIKGNLKQIIDGDYTLQIKGNMDFIVNKEMYQSTGKDMKQNIGGKHILQASSGDFTIAPIIAHN